jgi:hypothetical protein
MASGRLMVMVATPSLTVLSTYEKSQAASPWSVKNAGTVQPLPAVSA